MKILSIIIPAYNSQAFLDKCIGSLLVPEILDRLEIIYSFQAILTFKT